MGENKDKKRIEHSGTVNLEAKISTSDRDKKNEKLELRDVMALTAVITSNVTVILTYLGLTMDMFDIKTTPAMEFIIAITGLAAIVVALVFEIVILSKFLANK